MKQCALFELFEEVITIQPRIIKYLEWLQKAHIYLKDAPIDAPESLEKLLKDVQFRQDRIEAHYAEGLDCNYVKGTNA